MSDNALEHVEKTKTSVGDLARERAERIHVGQKRKDLPEAADAGNFRDLKLPSEISGEQATQTLKPQGGERHPHPEVKARHPYVYYKGRGDYSEEIVRKYLNGINLNEVQYNFPNFDISSPHELCSCKVFGLEDGTMSRTVLDNLTREFKQVVNPESARNLAAEKAFKTIHSQEPETWEALRSYIPNNVVEAVESGRSVNCGEVATMRVPHQQLDQLRAHIGRIALGNPEPFGIVEPDGSERLVQRVDRLLREHLKPMPANLDEMHSFGTILEKIAASS